ncbi:MAG: anthranilate phosphoribosyltransferase [Verrucomicrobia bacterium]|nr:anthranilate phosphoribosyltransferase [Verrucomicrobiota bacterium]
MQELEQQLRAGKDLTRDQVRVATEFLLDPEITAERKVVFLRALSDKGEKPGEIALFVEEFLRHAVDPGIDPVTLPGPVLDVVGTGGDKLNLFNVSTTSIFILAAGGVVIIKHGNRGITGKSGGADVLEALGVKINLLPADLGRCLHDTGIGFIFAPLYHPAFKAVVEARKILAAEGRRSIFNLLGPLMNPARPAHQLVGVFDEKLVPVFAEILRELGRKTAWVVHGLTNDGRGMDELSTIGQSRIAKLEAGKITMEELDPVTLGFVPAEVADLVGGDAQENAETLEGILACRIKGPRRDLAVLNAAAGFVITGKSIDLAAGKKLAEDLLDRGAAHAKLRALQDWC